MKCLLDEGWIWLMMAQRYVLSMAPGLLAAALLYAALRPFRIRRLTARGLQSSRKRETILLLFWMFAGGVAFLTLMPWDFWWPDVLRHGYKGTFFQLGTVDLDPLHMFDGWFNLLGNIIMFLPFGFCPALLWRKFGWRRALFTGLCLTGLIECWQLLVGRAFDAGDLLLNTAGVLGGFWLCGRAGCRGRLACPTSESENIENQ